MFDSTLTIDLLTRALDVSALRQAVYSANIANASVPGYQRLEVNFDQQLEGFAAAFDSASKADQTHLSMSAPSVIATGTAVKLDQEVAAMARNSLQYQTLVGAYERMSALTRLAIREGRE
ncbi:MAG TPA: flagellar basal body rod protein FlgB [Steroidobacteraceae bacterium]|nr:flagellar basal body rod protein FlgB [Steroidobacteraceae bacterium]